MITGSQRQPQKMLKPVDKTFLPIALFSGHRITQRMIMLQ